MLNFALINLINKLILFEEVVPKNQQIFVSKAQQ